MAWVITYEEIYNAPTLHQGHFANLKHDDGTYRIWLSRMTSADGELEPVQVEQFIEGVWTSIPLHESPWEFIGCGPRHAVRQEGGWLREDGFHPDRT